MNTQQSYLLLGARTVGMKHVDRSAVKVIERVLGMGASGRLYRRLRTRDGLVYNIRTITAQYEDVGYFAVSTSCGPDQVERVRDVILEEWDKLCQNGITDEELRTAQSNYAGTLARKFETNRALAGIIGVEYLLYKPETMTDAITRINAVQREEVIKAAQLYLDATRYVMVSMGPK